MRSRRSVAVALALWLVSGAAPVRGFAQPARQAPAGEGQVAPLLSSPVWSQPVTVLDYLLLQLRADLDQRAKSWQDMERSGLWTSPPPLGPRVTASAGVRRADGKIVVGFDVSVERFTKPFREICASFMELDLAQSVGVGKIYRERPVIRRNWYSHLMPRSVFAQLSEDEFDTALDQLQAHVVLHVWLYERPAERGISCDRPALGDSMTVREFVRGRPTDRIPD